MARKGLSPTQRSLALLRERGCLVATVEKYNAFVGPYGVRQDVWGFGDLLVVEPGKVGAMLVQCCAGSGMAAHRTKIRVECGEDAATWLRAGNRIELHGWRKLKLHRGGKAERWQPRVEEITLADVPRGEDPAEALVRDGGLPAR